MLSSRSRSSQRLIKLVSELLVRPPFDHPLPPPGAAPLEVELAELGEADVEPLDEGKPDELGQLRDESAVEPLVPWEMEADLGERNEIDGPWLLGVVFDSVWFIGHSASWLMWSASRIRRQAGASRTGRKRGREGRCRRKMSSASDCRRRRLRLVAGLSPRRCGWCASWDQ